ncbi:AcrR family transcriptional regulator [Rhizobium tibeticum]|uniref:TetR/AcrR family transcriptional regulator n=1 Tax=Rhizobium tibeticum TaxID=501024 RepID=UPI002785995F|nr:TetR/AcrR family transcriptional regulator [Rhizobium tibeticum]MDP9810105.1 AcrR family transcriptional regulator [Rhizobium tibeticum]
MAQRLKEEVRQRILSAALQTFAETGYLDTKLATIAERADIATSNLYKYFSSKEALFDAVLRPEHAATLLRRLRARLQELRSLDDWMNSDTGVSAAAADLLDFWVLERQRTLILLAGAAGTRYAEVKDMFVREMQRSIERHIEQLRDGPLQTVERQILKNTVFVICAILRQHESRDEVRTAVRAFWAYQLAGLKNFVAHAQTEV